MVDRRSGDVVGEELVKQNCALLTYVPHDVEILDV